jgi:hypothetical protein
MEKDETIERFLARPVDEGVFAGSELIQAFMWMTTKIKAEEEEES